MSVVEDRILDVWRWCNTAFADKGRILRFPANTDPKDTYQWRYATRLARRLEEWDLDDETARAFIVTAVRYAYDHSLLHKGMAAFFQSNILEVCYERMMQESKTSSTQLDSLKVTKDFLDRQNGSGNMVDILLQRERLGSFTNIVQWYLAGKIYDLYVALSLSCYRAINRLEKKDPTERDHLPKRVDIFLLRSNFIRDKSNKQKAIEILKEDWREMCLQR